MLKVVIITIIAIAISIVLLAIRIIIQKDGKFSSEHISQNQRMRQDGIHCATSQDRENRKKQKKKLHINQL